MRFRTKVFNIDCIHHFTNVVNTINKLLKKCTLRLTPDKLYFILPDQVSNGGVSMWCELKQANFFDEYQMDGVSSEHNEIYMEIIAENIVRALKSAHNAKSMKIKLTKKQTPCLTVEIELPSLNSSSRLVTHDIPVSVIPRRLWDEYQEPTMPEFHVSICMPPLKTLKNIAERMKNLSTYLTLSANQEGDMVMKVETELVTVATRFQNLELPPFKDDDIASQAPSKLWPPTEMASARVDIRKFLQFLAGQQINPFKVICNIVNQSAIHFFLIHDDISLQYFIPAASV
ncbi:checkpoint protein HUS1-like [Clavelina lepadiformis]|uniref:checkpoint protein HUS1-like n=1 Tax=Clavelina lepadiformis TaxID=159417 RepID=UPI0040434388